MLDPQPGVFAFLGKYPGQCAIYMRLAAAFAASKRMEYAPRVLKFRNWGNLGEGCQGDCIKD
jgi:hypothetical protein